MRKIALTIFTALLALGAAQGQDRGTLQVATDVGFSPFAFTTASGEVTGFSVDLINNLYPRLGYSAVEIVDVNFGSIFAGLYGERFDFILGMVTITEERAQEMLFSEPYLPTGLSLMASSSVDPLAGFEDLQGKAIAVNSGSLSDTWATANSEAYGFTVQRYNNVSDAFQAVGTNRAYVAMAETPVVRYATVENSRFAEVLTIDTGQSFGFAFRPGDSAQRAEIENALECAKLDGSLAEIHRKWFNAEPDQGLAAASVYVGYGAPNFSGYELDYHVPDCN